MMAVYVVCMMQDGEAPNVVAGPRVGGKAAEVYIRSGDDTSVILHGSPEQLRAVANKILAIMDEADVAAKREAELMLAVKRIKEELASEQVS